VQIDCRAHL